VRYLTLSEVLELHSRIMAHAGQTPVIANLGGLESTVAQPRMTFGGRDLYATAAEKAAALGFSLIKNHPFLDGNKRTGHAAMEVFLFLNGFEINASVDEQERAVLRMAAGECSREEFTEWLRHCIVQTR
jgi:death on curing protein